MCVPYSLQTIGSAVGVSKQVVCEWRRGRKLPSLPVRVRLQHAYGISAEAWTQEPMGEAPAPVVRAPFERAPRPPPAAVRPPPAALPVPAERPPSPAPVRTPPAATGRPPAPVKAPSRASGAPSTMDGVETLLGTIRDHRKRPNLLAAESVKLADAETRLLTLKHRLEKEQELLDERIVRSHPMWERIKSVLGATLVRWPDAARAVAAALREIEK